MSLTTDKVCGFMLIQSDWNFSLKDVGAKIWITTKYFGSNHTTSHEDLCIESYNNGAPVFADSEHVQVEKVSKHSITLMNSLLGVKTQFLAPVEDFRNIHRSSITAFDVTQGGGLGVSVSLDGSCKVWDTATGDVRRVLDGHVGDVNCCKFFPSGLVVLSGGMDTQLKIWSAVDGYCARTLNGSHKSGIMDVDFVDRGRNIISCSRDGSILLWECGSGACISTVADGGSSFDSVNCCQIFSGDELADVETSEEKNELEVGTGGKVVVVARESGKLDCYNLLTKSMMSSLQYNSALNACISINSNILVAGSQNGAVLVFDRRHPWEFAIEHLPCASPVLCLCSSKIRDKTCFWVSCGNGRCSLYQLPSSLSDSEHKIGSGQLRLVCELTGPDCDPVYQVVETDNFFVYISSRDGVIRKYDLRMLNIATKV